MNKKIPVIILLMFFLVSNKAQAAFDVQGVQLFKDNTVCINKIVNGTLTTVGLDLATLQTNTESVRSNISSSGSFCSPPPFFTGGATLTTVSGIITQAQPTVQGLSRGILISESAGDQGGASSGDPGGLNTFIASIGGINATVFEVSLPTGCDVIDDDDDIVGASSDLSTVNDFSLPTCTATAGFTVQCNAVSGLLTAINGLVPATSTTPAKIRFVVSAVNTIADGNMIDSILLRLDSQDIFCSSTVTGPLNATIIAKNNIDNPTRSETVGTANIGTPQQATKISYVTEAVTSQKGEISTNEISTTPILINATASTSKIQIEELNNDSIPIGGQSSATLINPSVSSNAENNTINLWLIPSSPTLFSNALNTSDITLSDSSLVINSAPVLVMTNADDLNAPFGSIVIPLRKNSGTTDPSSVKTTITINNLSLNAQGSMDGDTYTISVAFFEPLSGAIVNTPGVLSVNSTTNISNPQNFSAFAAGSTRALAQNIVVGGAINDATGASQITTASDLLALTSRDTVLGTPQITGFAKVVPAVTPIVLTKINATTTTGGKSIVTILGSTGASIGGAKVKIDSFSKDSMTAFDTVTITSRSDGSFSAKVQADFSQGDASISLKQTISGTDSTSVSQTISNPSLPPTITSSGGLACDKTVCGCTNTNCTPNITQVLDFVKTNGGLAQIITGGGSLLNEITNSAKKALGLS